MTNLTPFSPFETSTFNVEMIASFDCNGLLDELLLFLMPTMCHIRSVSEDFWSGPSLFGEEG